MQNPPPSQPGKSSTGLEENVAALLSYIFGWLSGLIFFLMEKDSKLVRFHAMQSILLNALVIVASIALYIVMMVLFLILSQVSGALSAIVGLLSVVVWLVFSAAVLVAWVMCLIKAYNFQFYKLPVIGDFAEKFSAK